MRVLLITNDYPPRPGGIQQYLANLVAQSGHEIRVLAPKDNASADGPNIVRGHTSWMMPTRRTVRWVREHIADFGPDMLVFGAPTPLAQVGPRLGTPYVVIAHGAEVALPAAFPIARQLLRRTFKKASSVLTVSEFTAARVTRLGAARTEVLGAGVDLDVFVPRNSADSEHTTLVCVSRFIPRKGHKRVIAAAERLNADGHPCDVLIVGKGRLEARIRRAAERASVDVRMEVDVPWSALPALYSEGDVFVMPARNRLLGLDVEGLGIVYLEGAAAGLPVVAGRSGGAPETVVPGVTGFVAETVDEIADAVVRVDGAMGVAGRRRVESMYSWHAVGERFDRFLEEAVG